MEKHSVRTAVCDNGVNRMCGICGYSGMDLDERLLDATTGRLRPRTLDDDGMFVHERVGLSNRLVDSPSYLGEQADEG